jgi:hypothetical protein
MTSKPAQEQALRDVAHHGAAPVADVHGPGGVRRHVLDDDLPSLPRLRPAIVLAFGHHALQRAEPRVGREPHVDEAGAGDLERGELAARVRGAHYLDDGLRQLSGRLAGALRQHHRRVHREVAVHRIARRVHREPDLGGRPAPLGCPLVQRLAEQLDHAISNHGARSYRGRASCARVAWRMRFLLRSPAAGRSRVTSPRPASAGAGRGRRGCHRPGAGGSGRGGRVWRGRAHAATRSAPR